MQKRLLTVLVLIATLSLAGFAQHKKSAKAAPTGPLPDKAYLQKIWDGWAGLDASKMREYYAQGDHTFFDLAPLKYNNWDEYQKGVAALLANYKSAKFTLNDDLQVHPAGEYAWCTSTVKEDALTKAGKHEMAQIRWTAVFEKQEGKWLIVHEHVSEPLQ